MSHDSLGNDKDYCVYEVFDLGSFDVIAKFMWQDDAENYALQKSVNGPALQVRRQIACDYYQIIPIKR